MRAAVLSSASPHVDVLLLALLRASGGGGVDAAPLPEVLAPLLRLAMARRNLGSLEMIKQAIAVPAGKDGRYAPWQFMALAGLLEARDAVGREPAIDFDRPFVSLMARRSSLDRRRQGRGSRTGRGRRAPGLSSQSRHQGPRSSAGAPASSGFGGACSRRPWPRSASQPTRSSRIFSCTTGAATRHRFAARSWTPYSAERHGLRRCFRRSRTAACRPVRSTRLAASSSREVAAIRSGLAPRAIFAQQARPRQAVVDSFRPALAMEGDRSAGAAVFKKLCASCHRLGNEGIEVGPDLLALADKSPESLLIAVLDPNRAFETKYASFTIATNDGRVLNGLVSNESATAVTLRRQDGKEDVLLRSQIDEMAASGQSLMPEGIEKDLKPRDLADLIAFLASSGAVKTRE